MLFIPTTAASWGLRMLLREPAFRIVAPILAGFMGYGLALHILSRIGRREARRPYRGWQGTVAELLLVVFVCFIEGCRTSFHERSRRSQQQCLVSCW